MSIFIMPFTAKSVLLLHILSNRGENIAGILDNNSSISGMLYNNHRIMTPATATTIDQRATVFLCEHRHYIANEIQLTQLGFKDIRRIDHILLADDVNCALPFINAEELIKIAPKQLNPLKQLPWMIKQFILSEDAKRSDALIIDILDIIITEKCTLKCTKCANLMQYFTHPAHMSLNQIIHDIDMIFSKTDWIRRLYLFGGEALMHKQFSQILSYAYQYKDHYGLLCTITNGTIIPSDSVLQEMHRTEMVVFISDYGDRSCNIDKLINKFEMHKIFYIRSSSMKWFEYQQLVNGEGRTAEAVFTNCKENCTSLRNGLLYRCPFLVHAETLHAIPYDEHNHINIGDEHVQKKDIANYLEIPERYASTIPPGCAYCSGYDVGNMCEVPVAEQTKVPLAYKKFVTTQATEQG